jgi:acetylornithine deacetylase/succinyl-diaminopimelate desuccinylase-like protein
MTFDLLDFHERAVRTPSDASVDAMRDLLVEELDGAGADPDVDEAGNVLAVREAEEEGPHLVVNTHIDTVPPHVPFERDGDLVRGRGACDAKGPLAALVDAFLAAEVGSGRLTLAVTPDEELLSRGADHLRDTLSADGYIVGEPTGLDVCNAAKGRFQGTVTIRGEAAHAAEPESGANAVRALAPVLQAIESYDETVGPPEHASLGRPTATPTMVEGGEASNQVAAEATITVDRRSVPPETAEGFRQQFQAHLEGWLPDTMSLDFAFTDRDTPFLEAFATDPDEALVEALADASGGQVRPFAAATEASYFARDAPTVIFGPGALADEEGPVAHAEREYVRRSEVERAAAAVRETLDALL